MANNEIVELLRDNNAMLKRICAWIDRVESGEYRDSEDMKQFVMNCVANMMISPRQSCDIIQPLNHGLNNDYIFYR